MKPIYDQLQLYQQIGGQLEEQLHNLFHTQLREHLLWQLCIQLENRINEETLQLLEKLHDHFLAHPMEKLMSERQQG